MRLGMVVYDGLDTVSGGFLYDRQLVERLRDRGHEVDVLPLPWGSYGANLLHNADRTVRGRLGDVDVVLEDELCHPSLVWHNRHLEDTPVVAVVHHLRSSEPRSRLGNGLSRAVERAYLGSVDGFVYNSETTRHTVETLVGPTDGVVAPPGQDHVDPNVSPGRIQSRARESETLRVVFVGSVIPRKGVDTLVRGLADLPSPKWSLAVVGDCTVDPSYADAVEKLVDTLGVGDRVEFFGRVPDDELASILRERDVLAVPSSYEGFGIAYLEGMGFGLPAIASAAGGADEVVTHGKTGFLVPPNDPDAVRVAARSLATDRDRLARMGVAARQRYEKHPSWAETSTRVEEFLERVTATESAGA